MAMPKTDSIVQNIPLNTLKKSPKNVRKTAHAKAHIEALADSIHAHGQTQNLLVATERDKAGEPSGFFLVTAGEGHRASNSCQELMSLCAYCVAMTIDGVSGDEDSKALDDLATAAGLGMRDWWTPTADGYLGSLPKERILDVLKEAGDGESTAMLRNLKRGELAHAAERHLAGKGLATELAASAGRMMNAAVARRYSRVRLFSRSLETELTQLLSDEPMSRLDQRTGLPRISASTALRFVL
jgi:hypothetical protein